MIDFEEASTLGRGNHVKVRRTMRNARTGHPAVLTIGWIGERRSGGFAYFEPVTNELNARFVDEDLEALKEKIRAAYQ